MRVLVLFDHGIAVLGFMTNASSSVAAHVLCCQEVSESGRRGSNSDRKIQISAPTLESSSSDFQLKPLPKGVIPLGNPTDLYTIAHHPAGEFSGPIIPLKLIPPPQARAKPLESETISPSVASITTTNDLPIVPDPVHGFLPPVMKTRQAPIFPPPIRTTGLDAIIVESRPIFSSRKLLDGSKKRLVAVRSPEQTNAQAFEECRRCNAFPQLACRYWRSRQVAEEHGLAWQRPESYILCRQTSGVGHDCELCYWAKVFEGTIRRERASRQTLHEKLLNQIMHPHYACDLCEEERLMPDEAGSSCEREAEERKERAKVRETAAQAKSQLQDIHEMKLVAEMVQWLWEAEVQGLGWV
ncbi:MAG: hypothetical protein Q9157_002241 [Trypethelium eluteriae]